jgi:hypothetical protein
LGLTLTPADFKEESLKKEDFKGLPKKGPVLNDRTASEQAATTVMLNGEEPSAYPNKVKTIASPETRAAAIQEHDQIRESLWQDAKGTIGNILADPSVDDETKINSLNVVTRSDTIDRGIKGTMELLADQALVSDAGPEETVEGAETRDYLVEGVREVVEHKRRMQKLVNGVRAKRDPSTVSTLFDVADLITPFAEWVHFTKLEKAIEETLGPDGLPQVDLKLLGERKEQVFSTLEGMSIEDRGKVVEALIEVIESNDGVLLPDGNDLVVLETLERMMVDNDYSDFERWFDNVTSVLDMVGIGGLVGALGKSTKVATKAAKTAKTGTAVSTDVHLTGEIVEPGTDIVVRGEQRAVEGPVIEGEFTDVTPEEADAITGSVRSDVDPASPSQVVKDVNPQRSREMHQTAREGQDDSAAKGLYGSSREEAMAKDILPEPGKDGTSPNKTEMNPPRNAETEDIRRQRRYEGNVLLSDAEWEAVRRKLVDRFQDVGGMWLHKASLTIRDKAEGGFKVMARYSPVDNGVTSAAKALENAQYHFRNYGLSKEDFKLLSRDPKTGDWVEESLKDAQAREELIKAGAGPELQREYSVGIDYDYQFRPEDMEVQELLTTGGGLLSRAVQFLDRMPTNFFAKAGQGSLIT